RRAVPAPAAAGPARAPFFAPTGPPRGRPPQLRRSHRAAGGARRADRKPHRLLALEGGAGAIRRLVALRSWIPASRRGAAGSRRDEPGIARDRAPDRAGNHTSG